MKLKNIKSLAIGLFVAFFAMIQIGCEQDWQKDFEPSVLTGANTATVAVSAVKDSTAMIDYSLSTVGRVFIAVVPGTDELETPDSQDLLKLTVADAVFATQIVMNDASELTASVKASGLIQNTSYKVFALPVNSDGVLGTIITTDAFTTSDIYKPVLDLDAGISPAISSGASQSTDFDLTLTFDEPVVLATDFDIQIGYRDAETKLISWVAVENDSIAISSNVVTIKQMQKLLNGQYVFLTIAEGAITDRSGNPFDGVTSGIVGTSLVGIYWRVSYEAKAALKVLPTDTTFITDAAAFTVIKLVYPYELSISSLDDYEKTNIVVKYYDEDVSTNYNMHPTTIDIDADTLIITIPNVAEYGSNVSLTIAEGTVWDVYGNDVAAGEYDWFISYGYTRDMMYGTYEAVCTSNWGGDYNMSLTVVEDPDSDDGVIITGFEGSDSAVVVIFNGDLATLTMAKDQSLGDLEGSGSEVFTYCGYYEDRVGRGTIAADGTVSMQWGSVIKGGANDGFYYDLYIASTWTKTTKKVNVTLRDNYVRKEKK